MFSLVVPCHNSHIKYVDNTINFFLKEYLKIVKLTNNRIHLIHQIIIIFCNVHSRSWENRMKNVIKKIKYTIENNYDLKNINFIYKSYSIPLNPGMARQKAYDVIKSKHVVFHDADDEPHPFKLSIMRYMFKNTNADHIHHPFQPIDLPFLFTNFDENINFKDIQYKIVDKNEIPMKGDKIKSLSTPDVGPVGHGLISIKTEALFKINWIDLRKGEDRQFISQSLNNNNKIIIIKLPLSKYDKYPVYKMKKYYPEIFKLYPN